MHLKNWLLHLRLELRVSDGSGLLLLLLNTLYGLLSLSVMLLVRASIGLVVGVLLVHLALIFIVCLVGSDWLSLVIRELSKLCLVGHWVLLLRIICLLLFRALVRQVAAH